MKKNPEKHGIKKPRLLIYKILKQILQEHMYFLAKLKEKNLRDMNETVNLAKEDVVAE